MGELHLEIIVDRLLREFKVEANVGKPQVAYKETVRKMADVDHKYARQSGGKGQYGHVKIRLEPNESGKGYEFRNEVVGGAIVNITSVVGITGNAGQANYTASKGGVIALTKTTAKELGSRNVRCNAVAPGFIESKMTEGLSDEIKKSYMDSIPLKRFGKVDDIAKAVAWLVSDDASYVTGQILSVNGGMI